MQQVKAILQQQIEFAKLRRDIQQQEDKTSPNVPFSQPKPASKTSIKMTKVQKQELVKQALQEQMVTKKVAKESQKQKEMEID